MLFWVQQAFAWVKMFWGYGESLHLMVTQLKLPSLSSHSHGSPKQKEKVIETAKLYSFEDECFRIKSLESQD